MTGWRASILLYDHLALGHFTPWIVLIIKAPVWKLQQSLVVKILMLIPLSHLIWERRSFKLILGHCGCCANDGLVDEFEKQLMPPLQIHLLLSPSAAPCHWCGANKVAAWCIYTAATLEVLTVSPDAKPHALVATRGGMSYCNSLDSKQFVYPDPWPLTSTKHFLTHNSPPWDTSPQLSFSFIAKLSLNHDCPHGQLTMCIHI